MKWMKFCLKTTTEAEEIVASMLVDLGVESVEIEDKIPLTKQELDAMYADIAPIVLPDDGVAYVSFYLEEGAAKEELIQAILNELEQMRSYVEVGEGTIEESLTEDVDWVNNWKQYFKRFSIDEVTVIPSWEEVAQEDQEQMVIRIDPGTAFGTGMHDTTQLCIRQLKRHIKQGDRVLDVGCGSGILGMLAIKFGAAFSFGTDLDPCAIEATYENMKVNKVEADRYKVVIGNIIEDEQLQVQAGVESYDVVVANILTEVLIPLTPIVKRCLKAGGILVTSGIINCNGKEEAMKAAIEEAGLEVVETTYQGEWVSVTAKKGLKE